LLARTTSEVGVQLLDSLEELWWSHKGLYKTDDEYRVYLTRYKKKLRLLGEDLVVEEVEWSDSTLVGTLGDSSTGPTRNNTFDTINGMFSWEADYGGKLKFGKANDSHFYSFYE